jgi:hypothetical protein
LRRPFARLDPLADTLSTIYRDVLRMRRPVADESVMLTTDGNGPAYRIFGKRAIYRWGDLIAWADPSANELRHARLQAFRKPLNDCAQV